MGELESLKVNVIGLGYVGLPAALKFANHGVEVVGTDVNQNLIKNLRKGILKFDEDGMEEELHLALKNGIKFSPQYEKAKIYIIAVPTNFDRKSKKIDPCYLVTAVKSILKVCPSKAIIVIESTVSPGTIDKFLKPLVKEKQLIFAHAPERIIPGKTLYEITYNDRVVGSDDHDTQIIIQKLYQTFCKGEIRTTDLRTAELTKVVENTFRDVNIAYANELKKICQLMSVDVHEVIKLANHHPRVNILNPSAGVGGHCISVDPWFLVGDFPDEAQIIAKARAINDSMPRYTWKNFLKHASSSNIGIYGLTYKPNIDDIRESPAIQLLEYLDNTGCLEKYHLYDPYITDKLFNHQVVDFEEFISLSEVILIMSPHEHLKKHLDRLKAAGIIIYDPFNVYEGVKKI